MFREPDQCDDASLFYREILLSYRLLFGQDYQSYKAFTMSGEDEMLDPLLKVLCSQPYDDEEPSEVYDHIEANHPSRRYCTRTDFPFLGKRLLKIQTHVRDHRPNNIQEIWKDTRDLPYWWAFWVCDWTCARDISLTAVQTAIAFGATSILLQLLQVCLRRVSHGKPLTFGQFIFTIVSV